MPCACRTLNACRACALQLISPRALLIVEDSICYRLFDTPRISIDVLRTIPGCDDGRTNWGFLHGSMKMVSSDCVRLSAGLFVLVLLYAIHLCGQHFDVVGRYNQVSRVGEHDKKIYGSHNFVIDSVIDVQFMSDAWALYDTGVDGLQRWCQTAIDCTMRVYPEKGNQPVNFSIRVERRIVSNGALLESCDVAMTHGFVWILSCGVSSKPATFKWMYSTRMGAVGKIEGSGGRQSTW